MRTHAAAQLIGDRSHQCDATATYTHGATRAYALLDGIGSSDAVRVWTHTTARRLARAAAIRDSAEAGLRAVHAVAAAERARRRTPSAVAVVAVAAPGQRLQIAWCGDARAYLLTGDRLWRLTKDHNKRQVLIDLGRTPDPYDRNTVTSYLGDTCDEPQIGTCTVPQRGRLLLASDGAYEPLEDAGEDLADYLAGSPRRAARTLTAAAIEFAPSHADNATTLVADLGAPGR
ncbi:protein phosphatase 2C domain-containing protein (plasmid) [Nonomuraea sp. NBC_00507]|uniref:PP2C family protein-serine/threonine phosphatase n=1 Tax=Nonomuraea sp. NBC_00507 TaxID=2976002 RepID=UPI002E180F2F